MDDPEKLKLRDLLGHFTAKQLWGAGGAIVGLTVAAFAGGAWLASQKYTLDFASERNGFAQQLLAREDSIRKISGEAEQAAALQRARLTEVEKQVAASKASTEASSKERAWLSLKAEFLEHYLRYELAMPGGGEDLERARSLFVGFVHRVWKTQEDSAVRVAMGTVSTQSDLPVVTRPVVNPFVRKELTVQRSANVQQRVIKTITFPDGSLYTVPYEIASPVHRRE